MYLCTPERWITTNYNSQCSRWLEWPCAQFSEAMSVVQHNSWSCKGEELISLHMNFVCSDIVVGVFLFLLFMKYVKLMHNLEVLFVQIFHLQNYITIFSDILYQRPALIIVRKFWFCSVFHCVNIQPLLIILKGYIPEMISNSDICVHDRGRLIITSTYIISQDNQVCFLTYCMMYS
jgi:hypothetical protein